MSRSLALILLAASLTACQSQPPEIDVATLATQECYARHPNAALEPGTRCERWGRYVATGPHREPFV